MGVRQILPFVGAAVGGYYGGWQGAQAGWAIGSAVGGAIDPKTIRGPSLGEIANQTSQEGVSRPIVFGTSPPITGNIIATSPPRVHKRHTSSKGGPKQEEERIERTYAIRVCEGPIAGFQRIWRNGKLVYDVGEDSLVSKEDNDRFLENARFYLGTYSQNASPDLEAVFGVGTTCPHRGTAYMVMADEDLTDFGGAIPQYAFQVVASGDIQTFGRTSIDGFRPLTRDPVVDSQQNSNLRNACVFVVVGRRVNEAELPIPQFRNTVSEGYVSMLEIGAAYSECFAGGAVGYEFRVYYRHIPRPVHGYNGMEGRYIGQLHFPDGDGGAYCVAVYRNVHPDVFGEVVSHIIHDAQTDPGPFHISPIDPVDGGPDGPTLTVVAWNTDFGDGAWYPALGLTYTPNGPTDQGQPGVYQDNVLSVEHPSGDGVDGYRFGIVDADDQENFYLRSPTDPPYYGGYNYSLTMRRIRILATPDLLISDPPTIAETATAICVRANLPEERVDTELLPDTQMLGLAITNSYPATESLRALGRVFLFDDASYDGKIHFVPRGGNSAATIVEEEMVDDDTAIEQTKRGDAIAIPRVLNLNYYDIENGGLSTAKQTSTRGGDRRAFGDLSLETPVVMTFEQAARVADITHKVMIEQAKGELKFAVSDRRIGLVNSNALIVQWHGRSERAIIVQCDIQDGYQEYTCVRDRQSAYTSLVEGIPPPKPTAPPSSIPGGTLIEILDIHILRDADDNAGLGYYVAVAGLKDAWSGALVELSYNGGVTYTDSLDITRSAIIGELVTELPAHPEAFPDTTNSITVRLRTFDAELQDSNLSGMLNRANLAIIGDEIVNFAAVDDLGNGLWEVSYFLRGRKGTTPVTHPIGARFVMLDLQDLNFIPASLADIGRTLTFRATSHGSSTDTGNTTSVVYVGRSQRERQPAYLSGHIDGGVLTASWQGVGRLGGGARVAQGQRFTGYRVRISDGLDSLQIDTTAQSIAQDIYSLDAITPRIGLPDHVSAGDGALQRVMYIGGHVFATVGSGSGGDSTAALRKFSGSGDEVIGSLPMDADSRIFAAIEADGFIYVTYSRGPADYSRIRKIDPSDLSIVDFETSVYFEYHGLAYDGTWLYVAKHEADEVVRFDPVTFIEDDSVFVDGPGMLSFAGGKVFALVGDEVTVIDTVTFTVSTSFPCVEHPLDILANGDLVFVQGRYQLGIYTHTGTEIAVHDNFGPDSGYVSYEYIKFLCTDGHYVFRWNGPVIECYLGATGTRLALLDLASGGPVGGFVNGFYVFTEGDPEEAGLEGADTTFYKALIGVVVQVSQLNSLTGEGPATEVTVS